MARYKEADRPRGYAPGLVLQLRQQEEGGALRSDVHQLPALDTYGRAEALVLVHGFNNHYGEACTAYQGFRMRQYERTAPERLPPAFEALFTDVFWPGDAAWGLFDVLDFLVYPEAVGTAKEAGRRLAKHLGAMPNLRLVHFVGHSLGCRVVLEAINFFLHNGGPAVGKVCLMAAAVPTFMLEADGCLADALEQPEEVRILHSDDDLVLRGAFPPGQTLAGGGEGFFPTALGSYGWTSAAGGRIENIDIGGAAHGDYWGHSGEPPCVLAAARVAEFFKFAAVNRTLGARDPGAAARSLDAGEREVAFVREICAREA